MEEVKLSIEPNGEMYDRFYRSSKEEFQPLVDVWNEMQQLAKDNKPIWVKLLKGDWAGSIAVFHPDDGGHSTDRYGNRSTWISINDSRGFGRQRPISYYAHGIARGVLKWPGRRNTKQESVTTSGDIVWLKGYEGPAVFKKVDYKAVQEKALEEKQQDIDDNDLSVGDKVLYINARYGSGMILCHGTIKEFKSDTRGQVFTIVQEDDTGGESKISQPFNMIWKKQ